MSNSPTDPIFQTSTIVDGNMSFRIGDTHGSLENRKQFLLKNDIDFNNHICMKCDHGAQISPVNWTSYPKALGATTQKDMLLSEVLVTQERKLALMLLTADCLPVSFYDPVTQTIALAHFSRETISKMLPQKTVSFLQKYFDVDPTNLLITIGPYIHTDSYTFPSNNHNIQSNIFPFTKEENGTIFVNLVSACNQQLAQAGVSLKHITASEVDTSASSNYFSHYASRTQNAPEGRIATVVMMK